MHPKRIIEHTVFSLKIKLKPFVKAHNTTCVKNGKYTVAPCGRIGKYKVQTVPGWRKLIEMICQTA